MEQEQVTNNAVQEPEVAKTTKGNLWGVSPHKIVVMDKFNARQDFGDLEELANQIDEKGVLNPITVQPFKDENGEEMYHLVDGERRYRAVMKLINERGKDIARIPAIFAPKNYKIEDLLLQQAMRNEGKPFTAYEWAMWIQNFMQRTGYTQSEVAKKIGKHPSAICQYLKLLEIDNDELREELKKGDVNATLIQKVLKNNNGDEKKTLDDIKQANETAKVKGKKKVSEKDFSGDFLVSKHTQDIKKGLDLFFKYINDFVEDNENTSLQTNIPLKEIYTELKKGKNIEEAIETIASKQLGLAI